MDGDAGPDMPVDIEVLPRVLKAMHLQNTKEKALNLPKLPYNK